MVPRHLEWAICLLLLRLWCCESGFLPPEGQSASEEVQWSGLHYYETAGKGREYGAGSGGVVGWCFHASRPGAGREAHFLPIPSLT